MENFSSELLRILSTIQGNGSFVTSGTADFTPPGLHVEGVGELGFPLNPVQWKALIGVARKAPFGKGSQTVTDPNVRSAWEIDAARLTFRNKEWSKFLKNLLQQVQEGLGIEEKTVSANLYKLLIYEPGDFFLSHKDSEKEPGMFGTLVVGLPSPHAGGELAVRFDGREETVDFSAAAGNYQLPFSAFYADCEHELKPVTEGCRVVLVYNLVQSKRADRLGAPRFSSQVGELAALLAASENAFEDEPKVVLLGHQYTPANFSLANLKLHDKPRAEALLEAAEKAGYFAGMALVTHYLMGELQEYDHYSRKRNRRRYWEEDEEDEDETDGTMGEVFEQSTSLDDWLPGGYPTLGEINLDETNLITEFELGEDDPIEKEAEGYTGNAGMTIQYWYHYGAVVLLPKSKLIDVVCQADFYVKLAWIDHFLKNWDTPGSQAPAHAKKLILNISEEEAARNGGVDDPNFSAIAGVLLKLKEEDFFAECEPVLVAGFEKFPAKDWVALLQNFKPDTVAPLFEFAVNRQKRKVLNHVLEVLLAVEASNSPRLQGFFSSQLDALPDYLTTVPLWKPETEEPDFSMHSWRAAAKNEPAKVVPILEKILQLSRHKENQDAWLRSMVEKTAHPLARKYVNQVLAPVVLNAKPTGALSQALRTICIRYLTDRTAVKPTPPPDWKREVPQAGSPRQKATWDIIASFLASPTEKVFDYRAAEGSRQIMTSAIQNANLDLSLETIKKGSPYTLRLTKNQAAYERELKIWTEDAKLLERLEGRG